MNITSHLRPTSAFFIAVLLFFGGAGTTFAQIEVPDSTVVEGKDADGRAWTLVPKDCLGDQAATECGFEEVLQLIANIMGLAFVAVLLLAALLFGYSGFLYAYSAGDTTKVKTAKGIFTNVAKGLIIVFLAYTIVQVIISIFGVQPEYNQFLFRF
ncbi:MAG: hypothetical protein WDZ74_02300 [Candidatus Paceibacterota bacterium]